MTSTPVSEPRKTVVYGRLRLPNTRSGLSLAQRYPLHVARCLLYTVWVGRGTAHAVCRLLARSMLPAAAHVVCCILHVARGFACCMLHAACCPLHLAPCTLRDARCMVCVAHCARRGAAHQFAEIA
jgi:hypothetical protein